VENPPPGGELKKPVGKRELARSSETKGRAFGGKRMTGVNEGAREEWNSSAEGLVGKKGRLSLIITGYRAMARRDWWRPLGAR
jgi:hypothetical protein